jgi:hypothetical protein
MYNNIVRRARASHGTSKKNKKITLQQTPCIYLFYTTSTTIEAYNVRASPIPWDYIDNNNYYCCCCRPCRPDVTANDRAAATDDRLFPQVHPFERIVYAIMRFSRMISPLLLTRVVSRLKLFYRYTYTRDGQLKVTTEPIFRILKFSGPKHRKKNSFKI